MPSSEWLGTSKVQSLIAFLRNKVQQKRECPFGVMVWDDGWMDLYGKSRHDLDGMCLLFVESASPQ